MSERKGISIQEDVHSRGEDLKQDGESFNDLLTRAFDALEAQDGDAARDRLDTQPDNPLTEDHIDDIATAVEGRVERVLDNMTRR